LGTDGLGSTSANLSGGSNGPGAIGSASGGGGGGDFGLVLQKAVPPGHSVKKGDVVAEFDRQFMLQRLEDYQAAVMQTEASFKKLKAELAVIHKIHDQSVQAAKADLEKARLDLKTAPVVGAMDAERMKLAVEEAEAQYQQLLSEEKFVTIGEQSQIRNAELDLAQARIELKRAQTNADRMLVKAGIDGLAVMQSTFRGSEFAQIQQGDQLWPGQPFMQIVDIRRMVINATINQVDIEHVRIGLKAKVRFDAFPGLELPAHVFAIGAITRPGGQRASFFKEVPIQLKLDETDPRVIPDLSVSADLLLETEENATVAPLGSIFQDGAGKTPYVLVQNGESWERRDVQLGLASNTAVVIRSGLKPGETVALEVPPEISSPGNTPRAGRQG
jgi:multidrug efflux pump subunit AcrA (membrane-fusion protein)